MRKNEKKENERFCITRLKSQRKIKRMEEIVLRIDVIKFQQKMIIVLRHQALKRSKIFFLFWSAVRCASLRFIMHTQKEREMEIWSMKDPSIQTLKLLFSIKPSKIQICVNFFFFNSITANKKSSESIQLCKYASKIDQLKFQNKKPADKTS